MSPAPLLRRLAIVAGVGLLVIGLSAVSVPPVWHGVRYALADPGGKKDKKDKGKSHKADKQEHDEDEADNDEGEGDGDEVAAAADQAAATPAPARPRAAQAARGVHAGRAERGGDFVAGEVVVANLSRDVRDAVRRLGFALLDERPLASLRLTITRLRVPRQMSAPAARRLLASRYPGILVALNALYRPQGQLVLPPPDYPAKLIGWGRVRDGCGKGLRIGVLDTAIDRATPSLRAARIVQRSFLAAGAATASREHGSAIASILVGRHSRGGAGLLPGAELSVASVFDSDPDGAPVADVVALVRGLDWLVGRGARVINMSLAGDANAVVARALERVLAGHAVVVAAAGNGGPDAPPPFPAAEPGVIAVTAVDSHSQPYADAGRGDYVAFAAPGVRIWTPGPTATGGYHTGTSFAVPFVTAAVAARLADGARADPRHIVDALARTAIDLGQPGKDPVFGRGLIQVANPCSIPTQ